MSADEFRVIAIRLLADPIAWAATAAIVVAIFAIALRVRRSRRIDQILGGAPSASEVHHPGLASKSMPALEGELKQNVFDPAARERLINDVIRRRKVDRQTAIRIVLEELRSEHDRYG